MDGITAPDVFSPSGTTSWTGFNTTDIPLEFCLLQGEIAEAFDAWRKGREDVAEELADVAIYLLSLAEMTGVDLQDQIEAKIAKNEAQEHFGCLRRAR